MGGFDGGADVRSTKERYKAFGKLLVILTTDKICCEYCASRSREAAYFLMRLCASFYTERSKTALRSVFSTASINILLYIEVNFMNKNILINFQRIMVFLRADIKNERSNDILYILSQTFDNLLSNKEMCDAIIEIMPDWKTQLKYGKSENQVIQKEIIDFVKQAIQIMKDKLSTDEFDFAYDIADILHVLSDIIIRNEENGYKEYWKVYIEKFNKKWQFYELTRF